MTTKQPEALRLAAWLNEGAWHQMTLGDVEAAGRELRRLHAVNADLVVALKAAYEASELSGISASLERMHMCRDAVRKVLREAITKATGEPA